MTEAQEDVLIAFSLHEGLYYPKVKELFTRQTKENQNIQIEEMKKVIKQPIPKNDLIRSSLKSPVDGDKEKDES